MYPQFGPADTADPDAVWEIPQTVLQAYIDLASASLSQVKWQDSWKIGMALYVAHFATLWLQSSSPAGSDAKRIAALGQARGIQVSRSVGDVSSSHQSVVSGWEDWGSWNLTSYGQQLM